MIINWLADKYTLDLNATMPIAIPNVGRNTLAKWFAEWQFTQVAEIGVERGAYSETLCEANPECTVFGVDAWCGYPNYRQNRNTWSAYWLDYEKAARDRAAKYKMELIKGFSMDVVKEFSDESLDAVYIDANHEFAHVVADIFEWSKKVKKGGVIAGHDYVLGRGKMEANDVVLALESYTKAYEIAPWFVLGANEITPGQIRDQFRSWMWVKS